MVFKRMFGWYLCSHLKKKHLLYTTCLIYLSTDLEPTDLTHCGFRTQGGCPDLSPWIQLEIFSGHVHEAFWGPQRLPLEWLLAYMKIKVPFSQLQRPFWDLRIPQDVPGETFFVMSGGHSGPDQQINLSTDFYIHRGGDVGTNSLKLLKCWTVFSSWTWKTEKNKGKVKGCRVVIWLMIVSTSIVVTDQGSKNVSLHQIVSRLCATELHNNVVIQMQKKVNLFSCEDDIKLLVLK